MKDRIKMIQNMTKMSQQDFARAIGVAPGSLSSLYSERTQPTSNYVYGIHKAFPEINVNWLMFGEGDMYETKPETLNDSQDIPSPAADTYADTKQVPSQSLFDQEEPAKDSVLPFQNVRRPSVPRPMPREHGAAPVDITAQQIHASTNTEKNFDSPRREVKEIRVFFSDGTYESFVKQPEK